MDGPIETEVKIPYPAGAAQAAALIQSCGYTLSSSRTLESDQVFDLPDRSLRNSGRLIRVRSAAGKVILTYKGPPSAGVLYKSREEIETTLSSSDAFVQILNRLGYVPSWRYEKYRTGFRAMGENGTVFLDETPIGVFLELEGPEYWIDGTAQRLGFTPKDYLTLSYAALYLQFLQTHVGPPDMLFDSPYRLLEKDS